MSELRFDDRVAVVTGAARGLGRSYSLLLASRGAKIIVNDPGVGLGGEGAAAGPAEDAAREIRASGGEAIACTESVATPEGGKAIVNAALNRYGRIDIFIHSAGITRRASIRDMTSEEFDAVLNVHLRGAFHVGQPAFAHMCDAGYGRIVLTSSIAGLYGEPSVLNYSVAKAGLIGLCNALALDGADKGVRCNIILPSALTRMAQGRDTSAFPPLGPELVAPAVGWLAHESCAISGEMMIALGGRMARAYVVETPGVFRDQWSIEQVAGDMDSIRHGGEPLVLPVLPSGFNDHLKYSFEMARTGRHIGPKFPLALPNRQF